MSAEANPDKGRMGALVNYVLFIVSPFTAGVLALGALMIAYLRRGGAGELVRSHYDYQIRNFWMDLIIVMVGAICGWGAVVSGFGAALIAAGVPLSGHYDVERVGVGAVILALLWALAWIWALAGLVLGSVFGAMRLASGLPARKTRAR